MKKVAKVGTKIIIWTPWGEIQIGTKMKTVVLWHQNRKYKIYTSRKMRKFLEG